MSANRYNSIVETMKAVLVPYTPLSTFGSVPGIITVPNMAAPVPVTGMDRFGATASLFDINDIPNIKSLGVWSNLGDGLAPRFAPLNIVWQATDNAGTPIGLPILGFGNFYVINLNRQEPQDYYRIFNSPQTRAALRTAVSLGATHSRIDIDLAMPNWVFDAWSMASAWNAAGFTLEAQLEVEHTLPLTV